MPIVPVVICVESRKEEETKTKKKTKKKPIRVLASRASLPPITTHGTRTRRCRRGRTDSCLHCTRHTLARYVLFILFILFTFSSSLRLSPFSSSLRTCRARKGTVRCSGIASTLSCGILFQENIKKTVLKREETAAWYEFVRIKKLPVGAAFLVVAAHLLLLLARRSPSPIGADQSSKDRR